jgi:hypothetical protein
MLEDDYFMDVQSTARSHREAWDLVGDDIFFPDKMRLRMITFLNFEDSDDADYGRDESYE